jgi:hypothetical protein
MPPYEHRRPEKHCFRARPQAAVWGRLAKVQSAADAQLFFLGRS